MLNLAEGRKMLKRSNVEVANVEDVNISETLSVTALNKNSALFKQMTRATVNRSSLN